MIDGYNAAEFRDLHKGSYYANWSIWFYLFCQLAKLKDPKSKFLYGDNIRKFDVSAGRSLWTKNILEIWVTYWIEANENLPDCYNIYKDRIIKAAPSMSCILGGEKRLEELYRAGAFSLEQFEKIEKNWERISDIPRETATKIARGENYSEDILYGERREIVSILLSLHNMIAEGKMASREIPIDDITNYLLDSYRQKMYCADEKIDLLKKSLNYIKTKLIDDEIKQAEKCELIIILLNYFLVMN